MNKEMTKKIEKWLNKYNEFMIKFLIGATLFGMVLCLIGGVPVEKFGIQIALTIIVVIFLYSVSDTNENPPLNRFFKKVINLFKKS